MFGAGTPPPASPQSPASPRDPALPQPGLTRQLVRLQPAVRVDPAQHEVVREAAGGRGATPRPGRAPRRSRSSRPRCSCRRRRLRGLAAEAAAWLRSPRARPRAIRASPWPHSRRSLAQPRPRSAPGKWLSSSQPGRSRSWCLAGRGERECRREARVAAAALASWEPRRLAPAGQVERRSGGGSAGRAGARRGGRAREGRERAFRRCVRARPAGSGRSTGCWRDSCQPGGRGCGTRAPHTRASGCQQEAKPQRKCFLL